MKEKELWKCMDAIETDPYKVIETCEKAEQIYQKEFAHHGATILDVGKLQFHLISPIVWGIQAIMVVLFGCSMFFIKGNETTELFALLFTMFPVCMAILNILEIYKSMTFGMYEIECGTRYDIRFILWLRMLAMGISDVVIFSILLCICTMTLSYPIQFIALYLLVPFISSLCIAFALWLLIPGRQSDIQTIGFVLGYGICLSVLIHSYQVYERWGQNIWISILFVLCMVLCIEGWITFKNLHRRTFPVNAGRGGSL